MNNNLSKFAVLLMLASPLAAQASMSHQQMPDSHPSSAFDGIIDIPNHARQPRHGNWTEAADHWLLPLSRWASTDWESINPQTLTPGLHRLSFDDFERHHVSNGEHPFPHTPHAQHPLPHPDVSAVPIPGAAWLFAGALALASVAKKRFSKR